MTLQETTADNYRALPQIPRADVTLLWHSDYYDVPISGLALLRGERLWFQMIDESGDPEGAWSGQSLLIRLSEQQLREEDWWHELFRLHVGTHTDHVRADGDPGTVRPHDQWDAFYNANAHRVPLDLSQNEVLGWFEM